MRKFLFVFLISIPTYAADITITIDDSIYPQVVQNFGAQNGYQASIIDSNNPTGPKIPNPETIDQFVARKTSDFVFENYKAASAVGAAESARSTAVAAADANKNLFTSKTSVVPKQGVQ